MSKRVGRTQGGAGRGPAGEGEREEVQGGARLAVALEKLERQILALENRAERSGSQPPTAAGMTSWLGSLLQGITTVSIVAAAFWLGSLSNKLAETSVKTDKLYGIVLESRDGLSARVTSIEAKLDSMETKLDSIDRKLTGLSETRRGAGGD